MRLLISGSKIQNLLKMFEQVDPDLAGKLFYIQAIVGHIRGRVTQSTGRRLKSRTLK